jgi:hypothetical protein
MDAIAMPRYFFTVQTLNNVVEDDPGGTTLPDITAALAHAERVIRSLRRDGGHDDPALTMLVKDETRHAVLFLPFIAGGD